MIQLTDAQVIVNNEVVAIEPGTLKWKEGLGEQKVRSASVGAGKTEPVFSNDLSTSIGSVSFELAVTPEHIALARDWKTRGNGNVVQVIGVTPEGSVQKTFAGAALTNDYDVEVGPDTTISLEFMSNPAV